MTKRVSEISSSPAQRAKQHGDMRRHADPSPRAEEPPQDIDAFRLRLARQINGIVGNRQHRWRTCSERACLRRRACTAPRIQCSNGLPSRHLSPEQEQRMRAQPAPVLRSARSARG